MAKVSFASLKLKVEKPVKTFEFNGASVEVAQYIGTEDLSDLIAATMKKAKRDGIFDPVLLNAYKTLHLIYLCTNLTFTEKQQEDELKLYDMLKSNGFVEEFVKALGPVTYNEVDNYLYMAVVKAEAYNKTAAALVNDLVNKLPLNVENAAGLIKNFDKDKFQEVIQFAQAANGGRPIEE